MEGAEREEEQQGSGSGTVPRLSLVGAAAEPGGKDGKAVPKSLKAKDKHPAPLPTAALPYSKPITRKATSTVSPKASPRDGTQQRTPRAGRLPSG